MSSAFLATAATCCGAYALFAGVVFSPALAAQGGAKIAFTRGYEAVHVIDRDGRDVRRVSPRTWESGYPVWSPDGTRIAFIKTGPSPSAYDTRDEVYVVRADGTGLRRLTRNNRHDADPTWSPDGKQIAFESTRSGIHVVSANGGVSRLIPTVEHADQPDWSPVSNTIAYVASGAAIYTIKTDGTQPHRLTDPGTGQDSLPTWSPEGAASPSSERLTSATRESAVMRSTSSTPTEGTFES